MTAKNSTEAFRQAERCFATGCATRVGSIISVFFEAAGDQSDSFPAIQGAESSWRELDGLPAEQKLRRRLPRIIAGLQRRAEESEVPWGRAVYHAIASVGALVREWESDSPDFSQVTGEAVAVAVEFDRLGIAAPGGHNSWLSYELSGQAVLAVQVFRDPGLIGPPEMFVIQSAAEYGSTPYREAAKGLAGL
jgi:hypothetical protein